MGGGGDSGEGGGPSEAEKMSDLVMKVWSMCVCVTGQEERLAWDREKGEVGVRPGEVGCGGAMEAGL